MIIVNSKQAKYNRDKTILINIRLMKNTEQDIIKKLEEVDNKSGYIKALIRKDIAKDK